MRLVLTIVFIGLITGIISCKKEIKYTYLNDYIKSYCSFQSGSYWIYQNDSTFLEDSLFVKFFRDDFDGIPRDGKIDEKEEVMFCNLNSILYPDTNFSYSLESSDDIGIFSFFKYQVLFSFTNNSILSAGSNFVSYYDTLSVNGTIYNSVYKIVNIRFSSSDLEDSVVAYFANHKGAIKWNIFYKNSLPKSWSILRAKIIQ